MSSMQPNSESKSISPIVARSMAPGLMSPSVTPRRKPSRPFLSRPLAKSKYSLAKFEAICARTANTRQTKAGTQRKLPYSAAQPQPAMTPATLTGSVCSRIASIQELNAEGWLFSFLVIFLKAAQSYEKNHCPGLRLRILKNSCITLRHSSSSIPPRTRVRG